MHWLVETTLGNALCASLLAAAVLAIGRFWRKAAVLHVLWVLVLVKLMLPGVVPLSVPGPWAEMAQLLRGPREVAANDPPAAVERKAATAASHPLGEGAGLAADILEPPETESALSSDAPAEDIAEETADVPRKTLIRVVDGHVEAVPPLPESKPGTNDRDRELSPSESGAVSETGDWIAAAGDRMAAAPGADGERTREDDRNREPSAAASLSGLLPPFSTLLPLLLYVSLAGSGLWLALAAIRVARFQAVLRDARRAPRALQRQVAALSYEIGLSRAPVVLVIAGPISPMVWWLLGRPRLLFPKGLLSRLKGDALDTLLLHELAHLRRRDHLVRWLELLVTGLFWWHPVVWVARRQMHACEEECCDALVVAHRPGHNKTYAAAIVETLDFLAGEPRLALPLTSGIGRMVALERRLRLIMRPAAPPRISAVAWLGVLLFAAVLLPLVPTAAQSGDEPQAKSEAKSQKAETEAASEKTPAEAPLEPASVVSAISLLDPTEFEAKPQPLAPKNGQIFSLRYSHDGRSIVTSGGNWLTTGSVTLWDVAGRSPVETWRTTRGVKAVSFSPDDKRVAAVGWDSVLIVRNLSDGNEVFSTSIGGSPARLDWSPDGRYLATAAEGYMKDGNWAGTDVKLWDAETGEELARLEGDLVRFQDVAFSPDSKLVAAVGGNTNESGQINVWDVESRRQVLVIKGQEKGMYGVTFSPDGALLATGASDGAKLWDVKTGMLKSTLSGGGAGVGRPAFSPDGKLLATPGHDAAIRLWDVKDGKPLATLNGHNGIVQAVAFSPDGKTLASGGDDELLHLWDVPARRQLEVISRRDISPQIVLALAHSPDGRLIAVAGENQTVQLFDTADGELAGVLEGFDDVVASLAFSPDGKLLATGAFDNTVRLWNVADLSEVRRFDGHTNWVYAVAFSADGKRLASGGYDKTIRVWNVDDGKQLALLEGHTAAVRALAFLAGGTQLVSGSADRTLRIWNVAEQKELRTLKGHEGSIRAAAVSPDGNTLASAAEDKTVRLWNLDTGELVHTLSDQDEMVWSLAFSPGGRTLASGGFRGRIKLWNPESGAERGTLNGHQEAVSALSFAPDGRALVSGSYDKTIKVWKPKMPPITALLTLSDLDRPANVDLSPDGKLMAVGSRDRLVRVYDMRTGEALHSLAGHKWGIVRVRFSPDGKLLASGDYGAFVRLWDVQTGDSYGVFNKEGTETRDLAFSPDGRHLAASSWDGSVVVWDVRARSIKFELPKQPLPVSGVAVSPDGKTLATVTGNWKEWRKPGELKLWDAETGEEIATIPGHSLEIKWVQFSPDGKTLATSGGQQINVWDVASRSLRSKIDHSSAMPAAVFLPRSNLLAVGDMKGGVTLWDTVSGRQLSRFEGHTEMVSSLSASPDGSLLASTSADGTVKLWPVGGLRQKQEINAGSYIFNAAVSPDGKRVATGGVSGLVLWDLETGKLARRLDRPRGKLAGLAYSPDGKRLLSGGEDHLLRLWNLETGREIQTLEGHRQEIRAAAFSPDGKLAASAGFDNEIILWDLESGQERDRFDGHKFVVWTLAFSPDGRRLASGSSDGTARVWNVESGAQMCVCRAGTLINKIEFSPDGKQLLTGQGGAAMSLWDARTGERLQRYFGHTGRNVTAAFSPDGRHIYSAGEGGDVLFWDIDRERPIRRLGSHGVTVKAIALAGDQVVTAGEDGKLRLWSLTPGAGGSSAAQVASWSVRPAVPAVRQIEPERTLSQHDTRLWFVAYSPDGKHLASGGGDKQVKLWDAEQGSVSRTFLGLSGAARCGAFSPDGKWLAVGGNEVRVWDVETGELVKSLDEHAAPVNGIAFSPDGSRLASASEDRKVHICDTDDWKVLQTLNSPTRDFQAVAFSADGDMLITSTANLNLPRQRGEIRLWDANSGRSLDRVAQNVITWPVFSPNGQQLAFRSASGLAIVWDLLGKREQTLLVSSHNADRLAFSPDGRLVATAYGDGTIRLNDARTGHLLAEMHGHSGEVRSLSFSPDSLTLASASFDHTIKLWPVARALETEK